MYSASCSSFVIVCCRVIVSPFAIVFIKNLTLFLLVERPWIIHLPAAFINGNCNLAPPFRGTFAGIVVGLVGHIRPMYSARIRGIVGIRAFHLIPRLPNVTMFITLTLTTDASKLLRKSTFQ